MPKDKHTNPPAELLKISAYVTAGSFLFLLGLSYRFKMPLPSLLVKIKECYYSPSVSPGPIGEINGLNFHIYVYGLIFLLCVIAIIKTIFTCYRKKTAFLLKEHCYLIPLITSIVLVWVVMLQTVNQIPVFKNAIHTFAGKSLTEKQSYIHGWTYDFPRFTRAIFPGRHRCEFITDADLTHDPGMWQHRQLAYFFYPNIDIRGIYSELPIDCLVLSKTRKFKEDEIPNDFEIKGVFNSRHVLAVKKTSTTDKNE